MAPLTVVCVEIGNYCGRGQEYVAKLANMCGRHLPRHRFCVISDRDVYSDGIVRIASEPIEGPDAEVWWQMLQVFRPGLFTGPTLYLDLDVVVSADASGLVALLDQHPGVWALDDWAWPISTPRAVSSEGAKLTISSGEGLAGKALVMEFDLTGAYGYTIARRDISLDLPPNYQFTFDMRAEAPVNNFEFKIVDSLENVWWIKKLNVTYPVEWSKQRIKKRHLTFAWGPSGGGEIHHVKAVEFVVSSGSGGKGKVFIDNFRFVPVDVGAAAQAKTSVRVSSAGQGYEGVLDSTGGVLTNWRGSGKSRSSNGLQMDFGYQKEIGGLAIDWEPGRAGRRRNAISSRAACIGTVIACA